SPLCTPARAGLFTGMFSSSAGAAANQMPLFATVRTLGRIFSAGGYAAGYIGKWHLDGSAGGYYGTGEPADGFLPEWWYDGRRFIEEIGQEGFVRWRRGQDVPAELCWATRVADRAERFLEQYHDRPFYLVVSFDEPHGPSTAPREFYDLYRGSVRPWRANMGDRLEAKPAIHRAFEEYFRLRSQSGRGGHVEPAPTVANSPRYYGCNSFVDQQIGRVVAAVDRLCADRTVIVYTSDHGDHQGEHGLLAKGPTMYEETIHVPLMIRAPGLTQPGSVCNELISHIDLAPTVLRLAGLGGHEQLQGCDATGLLAEPGRAIREAVFLEYHRFGVPHHTRWGFVPIRCVRTKRYKLVLNLLDRDELYDLLEDPGELDNRIDDPRLADVRNELHDRLLAWMDARLDPLRGNGWWARPWRPGHVMPANYEPASLDCRAGGILPGGAEG
ncbi:MAG: sulfatase-like hydrolase/transferase, partial [Phycisphaerae bacterium]